MSFRKLLPPTQSVVKVEMIVKSNEGQRGICRRGNEGRGVSRGKPEGRKHGRGGREVVGEGGGAGGKVERRRQGARGRGPNYQGDFWQPITDQNQSHIRTASTISSLLRNLLTKLTCVQVDNAS